jgi:hypothetical protein
VRHHFQHQAARLLIRISDRSCLTTIIFSLLCNSAYLADRGLVLFISRFVASICFSIFMLFPICWLVKA